jgi:PTH1 family peptidyl-tRNA hydrolase
MRGLFSRTRETEETSGRYLIVGLGNPGKTHQHNRHNVGFMLVDRLAARHDIPLRKVQSKAIVGVGHIRNRPVVLAKPQTFMNLSGDSVGPLLKYYRVEPANLLVVYDELDIPAWTIRLREKGSAGGHNGMRSIIQHAGSDFPRLRLGIGRPPGRMDPAAYVLQDFSKADQPLLSELLDKAVAAVECYLTDGIDLAMSRYNGSIVAGAEPATE